MATTSIVRLDMDERSGFEGPHEGTDDGAMTHLEALLLSADDEDTRDLDLALSVIQELDVSLFEQEFPSINSTSGDTEELRMLQALYQDNSISSDGSFTSYTELLTADSLVLHPVSAAGHASPASVKQKEKKCTYQNRREEIQTLRDEVVTLESQVRKLKQIKQRRTQAAAGKRSLQERSAAFDTVEGENAELKAAILAQKAQLNNLFETMQANKLIVTTRPIYKDEPELEKKPSC